ncbi:MAG: M23 family metallopeptidase [Sphingobacteriaceae bacterium]|nr:M23 family metallopeptidase [Sphingobacteriaceae bacterium]
MKFIIAFFLVGSFTAANSQDLKVFWEKNDLGYTLFAKNDEYCPVSISLDLNITNIVFSEGDKKIFIVPPKAEKFQIGKLALIPGKGGNFSYKYKSVLGDITKAEYEKDKGYDLPFQKGRSFNVFQGYNGSFSHQNENSIDFTMPEGTEVLAARDGMVIKVVQNNTQSCAEKECKKYNNFILVYHPDGTFAEYVHLKFNSSKVKPGDAIKVGTLLGLSGNTGWSTGPHLHFVCFIPGFDKRNTVQTKFKTNTGTSLEYLVEKKTYLKEY